MTRRIAPRLGGLLALIVAALLLARGAGTLLPRGDRLAWTAPAWQLRDGTIVANTDLFIWYRGSVVNLTKDAANDSVPAWSPDGRLAWASNRDGSHDVYLLQGSTPVNVSGSEWGIGGFVWSPDGRLAWVAWDASNGWPGETIHIWDGARVRLVSRDSSVEWPITWLDDGRLRWSGWSNELPPVRYIYTWDGAQIRARALDLSSVGSITWANRGDIALVVLDGFNVDTVYAAPPDAEGALHPIYAEYGITPNMAWSYDGRLAWVEVQAPGSVRIVVWDGGETVSIPVSDAPRVLSWSQDGRLAWADGGGGGRWVIKVWDGDAIQVVHQDMLLASPPRWSRDGRLAWGATNGREWHISIWDGAFTYRVSPLGISASEPAWGESGS